MQNTSSYQCTRLGYIIPIAIYGYLPTVLGSRSRNYELRLRLLTVLFTTNLKKFYQNKIVVAAKVIVNCYNFNPITSVKKDQMVSFKTIQGRSWNRSSPAIWICGCAEPEPKEIFSAPQHWCFLFVIVTYYQCFQCGLVWSPCEFFSF